MIHKTSRLQTEMYLMIKRPFDAACPLVLVQSPKRKEDTSFILMDTMKNQVKIPQTVDEWESGFYIKLPAGGFPMLGRYTHPQRFVSVKKCEGEIESTTSKYSTASCATPDMRDNITLFYFKPAIVGDKDDTVEGAPLGDKGNTAVEGAPVGDNGDTAVEGAPVENNGDTAVEGAPLGDNGDTAVEGAQVENNGDTAVEGAQVENNGDTAVEGAQVENNGDTAIETAPVKDTNNTAFVNAPKGDNAKGSAVNQGTNVGAGTSLSTKDRKQQFIEGGGGDNDGLAVGRVAYVIGVVLAIAVACILHFLLSAVTVHDTISAVISSGAAIIIFTIVIVISIKLRWWLGGYLWRLFSTEDEIVEQEFIDLVGEEYVFPSQAKPGGHS